MENQKSYKVKSKDLIPLYGIYNYLKRTTQAAFEGIKDNRKFRIATNSTLLCWYNAGLTIGAITGLEALL
jgi:hypothetical protein